MIVDHVGISRSLNSGFCRKTRRCWKAAKAFLLEEKLYITGSPLLCNFLTGFNKA